MNPFSGPGSSPFDLILCILLGVIMVIFWKVEGKLDDVW